MTFLNPFLLIALLAVAVPLLIHLINLRKPKKVRFSTLTFFDSLKASALKRIKIKRWLLLLLRSAAILMLCFALARPFIPSELGGTANQGQPAAIGILVDNSPSMDQVDRNGPFIDQVKRVASQIIENSQNEDRILLEVTNGESLDQPALTRSAAGLRLNEIETVNKGNILADNLRTLVYRLEQAPQPVKKIYLVTDAQASQFDPLHEIEAAIAGEYDVSVITVGEERQGNVAITGMELDSELLSRDQPVAISVSVKNFGSSAVRNHFLSLEYMDEMEGQHAVNLEAGENEDFTFEVIPGEDGALKGSFLLEGDELTFDNRRFFSIQIPEKRRILQVQDEQASDAGFSSYLSPVLEAAVSANELLEIEKVDWDSDLFAGSRTPDAILLDGVKNIPDYIIDDLVHYIQMGGGLLFLPSSGGELQSYNRFLERTNVGRYTGVEGSYGSFNGIDRLSSLREGHPLLDEIFDKSEDEELRVNLPEIFYYYRLEPSGGSGSYRLLNSEQGETLFLEQRFGDGRLMVSAIGSDPGWSNFPIKPIFAPLFYRSVLYLATSESGGFLEHTLSERFEFQLSGSPEDVALHIDEQQIIPERRTGFQGLTVSDEAKDWSPGFIELTAEEEKFVFAVNQDAMESDFEALEDQDLKDLLAEHFQSVSLQRIAGSEAEIAEQMQAAGMGHEIWFWFIVMAIIFLLTESFVARLFKAESIQ